MSNTAQIIWFGLALLGTLAAAFGAYASSPAPRPWYGPHFGWLGLFCFVMVFWWTAVQAA